ncbi:hypothetical protein CEXT_182641 [Caerostris extrusa]|uniref:Uncharacterized protein n=1 Tax=Caerostris extrusa TaxID=172846 RepID=A0AAV4SJC0_CAEEX|nr:hypothetical protein CEXT_182641 [Caerostris extrusa]
MDVEDPMKSSILLANQVLYFRQEWTLKIIKIPVSCYAKPSSLLSSRMDLRRSKWYLVSQTKFFALCRRVEDRKNFSVFELLISNRDLRTLQRNYSDALFPLEKFHRETYMEVRKFPKLGEVRQQDSSSSRLKSFAV